MNHFLSLLILSVSIAVVFTLITKEHQEERLRYFLKLLVYMILGSVVAAWVMWFIPW